MNIKNDASKYLENEKMKSYNSGVVFGSKGLAATLLLICYDDDKNDSEKIREIEKECRKLI